MLNNVNVKLSKIRERKLHPFQDEWNRPNVNRVIYNISPISAI